ncbi:MAG: reverse transcriptase family protein [Candidatus Brennerbacteria bacterium]
MHYLFNGTQLLAGVLGWPETKLEHAIRFQDHYEVHKKRKPRGGVRSIAVPYPIVKRFQRKFLQYFLYRIWQQGWLAPQIHGFLPGRSSVTNARLHARADARYVVRLDLKDAFPSVTGVVVRKVLAQIVATEVLTCRLLAADVSKEGRRDYPRPPLFSTRKAKWFRKLLLPGPPPKWLRNVKHHQVLEEFLDTLIPLVTYRGALPQGAPTSPFLLDLVLSHYGVPQMAQQWFEEKGIAVRVSVYADDFTISSATPIAVSDVEAFMAIVEEEGVFRFNRDKTLFFDRRQIAPLVTGLRLVHIGSRDGSKRLPGDSVSVPKKEIRKIRAIIHRAIFDENLRARAKGYVDYLHGVYGPTLPPQVARPWARLCSETQ